MASGWRWRRHRCEARGCGRQAFWSDADGRRVCTLHVMPISHPLVRVLIGDEPEEESEMPRVGGGGAAHGALEIDLGELDIETHGFHIDVTEHLLDDQGVGTVAECGDGECVAEAMDVGILDAGTLGAASDHMEKLAPVEGLAGVGGEEGSGAGRIALPTQTILEIAPNGLASDLAGEDNTGLVAFAVADEHPA